MRIFAPHPNAPLPPIHRALAVFGPTVVFPAWERTIAGAPIAALDDQALSVWKRLLLWPSRRLYFRANPRSQPYLWDVLTTFLGTAGQEPDISSVEWTLETSMAPVRDALAGGSFDTVFLMYMDAIGLGWSAVDALVVQWAAENNRCAIAVTGRRRVFAVDSQSCTLLLRQRRAVVTSLITEATCAPLIVLGAALLAAWDRLTGANSSEQA